MLNNELNDTTKLCGAEGNCRVDVNSSCVRRYTQPLSDTTSNVIVHRNIDHSHISVLHICFHMLGNSILTAVILLIYHHPSNCVLIASIDVVK